MNLFVIIILGIVQGITEFLPVSSSGHVLVISRLLQSASSFEFDVLVSFGTLFAVIIYYRKRFVEIFLDIYTRRDIGLAAKLIVATIPVAIVGLLFDSIIELYLHGTLTAIAMLLIVGLIMVVSASWKPKKQLGANTNLHKITYKQSILIGVAQCFSLISGSSRSGVTMLAALRLGFEKKTAAEWSFLMSVPAIGGASLKVLLSSEGRDFITTETTAFVVANVVSFVFGLAAIHVLLKILQRKGLYWFGWYRIILAAVLIVLLSVKIL